MRRASLCISVMAAVVLCWAASPLSVTAQPLSATITDVDFSALPRVQLRVCIERDGQIVRGLAAGSMTLLENGVPRTLSVRCPNGADYNSVVLVLDNSGSIFAALPKLIEAGKQLVDSLGPNDEAAIVTFGRSIQLAQSFTTDKALLKSVLDNMVASGGTALFDATMLGLEELNRRSGLRHAVIITDGEDNMSSSTDADVILEALRIDARLHTIAFDIAPAYRGLMESMAVRSGGAHFFVSRPSDLPAVYATIAAIITEPCCILEYKTTACADTLRSLLLTVFDRGDTARTSAQVTSPARPDRATLSLTVPDEILPNATEYGAIHWIPAPNPDLLLSVSFDISYDEKLVDIPLVPFTLGTLTQNQLVDMQRIAPGRTRIILDRIRPAMLTTQLVGFPIKALVADTSRKVAFSIVETVIAGCITHFRLVSDTTVICQCFRPLAISMDSILIVNGEEDITIPIIISDVEPGLLMQLDADIALPDGVELREIRNGTLLPSSVLQWEHEAGTVRFRARSALPSDTTGTLATLHLRTAASRKPVVHKFAVTYTELWQRCCPEDGTLPELTLIQDGSCEFLLRRVSSAIQASAAPNPVNGGVGTVLLRVPEGQAVEYAQVFILDMHGRRVLDIHHGPLPAGETRITFDATHLPAGRYTIATHTPGTTPHIQPLLLLR